MVAVIRAATPTALATLYCSLFGNAMPLRCRVHPVHRIGVWRTEIGFLAKNISLASGPFLTCPVAVGSATE